MKKPILICLTIIVNVFALKAQQKAETVIISGIVTDFNQKAVDSAFVELKNTDFSTAYKTYSDKNGHYSLEIKKGKYFALTSVKQSEYPLPNSVLPKDEQRLEFWCWNLIADQNIKIDIKYHRLEVYGVNIFKIQGGNPGYTIYCRPMSLTRVFSETDKELNFTDLCPPPDELEIKVTINGIPVKVNMKEKVREYVKEGICFGYLLHVDSPQQQKNKNYDIVRIEMTDLKNGDKGEAISFYEYKEFEK